MEGHLDALVPMPDEDAESKRNAIVAMLQEVCRRIDEGFE